MEMQPIRIRIVGEVRKPDGTLKTQQPTAREANEKGTDDGART